MSTIYASPQPDTGHVYVEINAADLDVACVQLLRVHADGSEHVVRPAVGVCTVLGEWQMLSGGLAVMWDTEAPLDEPFSYRIALEDPPVTEVRDTFTRLVPDGAGTADSGQEYEAGTMYSIGCGNQPGMWLPEAGGGYASTPDAASLDIVGDLDLRVRLHGIPGSSGPDWEPDEYMYLITKFYVTTNNRSFGLRLNAGGTLRLYWSADGTAELNSGDSDFLGIGGDASVRVTLDVDNGAGGRTIRFWYSFDEDLNTTDWSQLGGDIVQAGVTSIFAGNAPLEVSGRDGGTSQTLAGVIVAAAQARAGIGGAIRANPIFTDQPEGTTSFVDSAGLTWTLNGGAVIQPPCDIESVSVNGEALQIQGGPVRDHVFVGLNSPMFAAVDETIDLSLDELPVGAPVEVWLYARRIDDDNQDGLYLAVMAATDGSIDLELRERSGGVEAVLAGPVAPVETFTPGGWLRFRQQISGPVAAETWQAKMWDPAGAEPIGWDLTYGPGPLAFTEGTFAVAFRTVGVSQPLTLGVDNLLAAGTPWEGQSAEVELDSEGGLWIRDPLTPCNDLRVGLCWPPRPDCAPGDDVFFAALDVENYASQSSAFAPNDAVRPIAVIRKRRDADTNLTLVARTFTARDRLLQLLAPGDVLQLAGGEEWGLPDRYMDVQDVGVGRLHVDHRYEPRVFGLPYVTEDRPIGPGQGVCGTRVEDLCDGPYDSWDAMTTAGVTWAGLLAGAAAPVPPVVYGRTYAQIDALGDYSVIAAKTYYELAAGL